MADQMAKVHETFLLRDWGFPLQQISHRFRCLLLHVREDMGIQF